MNTALAIFAAITIVGILAFTLDDLFIDLVALMKRLTPKRISASDLQGLSLHPEKRFAIIVANWKEEDVLAGMVQGNVKQIAYANYSIFLGVYPNDTATWELARKLEQKFPQVSVIVNDRPGPTSKGQLLNYMVREILNSEAFSKFKYDAFLLQDSEDIIHPLSLRLMNRELDFADFVQIPVFSLRTDLHKLTAGSYADEFAEAHTKNLLVRESLGGAVPSAGVGTAISRELVIASSAANNGGFLNEATLTEDYQLGLMAGKLGFKTHFVCAYTLNQGVRDYIATREFFPHDIRAAIRQKTRWVVGIAFQGKQNLGWGNSPIETYFFWRDRRGPLNGVLILASTILFMLFSGYFVVIGELPSFSTNPVFLSLFWLNFSQMTLRLTARMRQTSQVYGLKFCLLVPARWLVANYINCLAAWNAYRTFHKSQRQGKTIQWVKTQHHLPANFGTEKGNEYVQA